mgnify:CR=1 FL=1
MIHRDPADALVRAFKYQGWQRLAGFMAARMTPLLAELDAPPGCPLVPIPSTPGRLRSRGFNPAEQIARALVAGLPEQVRPPVHELLLRPRETPRQVGLSPEERRANVRDAFVPVADLDGVRGDLVLIDDVFTTGATAVAAAEALAEASDVQVHVLTFARAIPELPAGDDPS